MKTTVFIVKANLIHLLTGEHHLTPIRDVSQPTTFSSPAALYYLHPSRITEPSLSLIPVPATLTVLFRPPCPSSPLPVYSQQSSQIMRGRSSLRTLQCSHVIQSRGQSPSHGPQGQPRSGPGLFFCLLLVSLCSLHFYYF